jgi:antitoxin MazE
MIVLTKIGNSQGIRIPKPLIEQAHLKDAELQLEVVNNGLLIKPIINMDRKSWRSNIEKVLSDNNQVEDEAVLHDFLNDSDLEDFEW